MSYTITEDCVLPSKGKIYSKHVNYIFKIRSMTTEEEMRRLAHTERPYKSLCDIIDSCIVGDKPGISSYDMCFADYQYLLQKLRIATYGPEYRLTTTCPQCMTTEEIKINLAEMELRSLDDALKIDLEVKLPCTGHIVKVKLTTPRDLDDNAVRRKELLRGKKLVDFDPVVLYSCMSSIETIDGVVYDRLKLEEFVRKLPMRDTNKIQNIASKYSGAIGYNMLLEHTCGSCGLDYTNTFRITSEYFGPTDDE